MSIDINSITAMVDWDETATIASGQTVSAAVNLGGGTLVGIITPAALTGTSFTFQTSDAIDGTYVTCEDGAGAAIAKTVSASKDIKIAPTDLLRRRYLKIVSNSAEAADRTLKLIISPV